ncbi:hypothetical protein PP_19 [Cyanophage PP]|uniref:Uncharacterized protein n=1 Tax=Cyanophage PP TaxID=434346 RepID=U5PS20_9CAUD|nr:hypothetical protein V420_gp19 [Cyanophage PP]AGY46486.1 hypothetical protein PP_19 [Cyanophage PP]
MMKRLLPLLLVLPLCLPLVACDEDRTDETINYLTGGDITETRAKNNLIRSKAKNWSQNKDKTCAPGMQPVKNKHGLTSCK